MVTHTISRIGLGSLFMAEYRGRGKEGKEFWQVAFSMCRTCLCIDSSVSTKRMGVNFGPATKECAPKCRHTEEMPYLENMKQPHCHLLRHMNEGRYQHSSAGPALHPSSRTQGIQVIYGHVLMKMQALNTFPTHR